MMNTEPVAHISEDGRVHSLSTHLRGTADLARLFADEFGYGQWGMTLGLWHDLGKHSVEFQQYIRAVCGIDAHIEIKPGRVDHSAAGALHAVARFGKLGRIFAYPIAGHHAGLADWQSETSGMGALIQRLQKKDLLESALAYGISEDILSHPFPTERPKPGNALNRSLWLRMLFSCLVDADFLDTEAFFDAPKAPKRENYPGLAALLPLFETYMCKKQAAARDTPVNRIRSAVLARCQEMANNASGIYSLTVPTGGGKALSSMAFALRHAVSCGQKRIIYVIPYTSIIEQTADQFREILGDAVVEHHSNIDVSSEGSESARSSLACENWNAPVIITTSVQFFESLFASRTSRCRKLHNIVNSVVILDEAQLLPPEFLNPSLEALDELQKNYGVTVIFCTATQPALGPQKTLDFDFKGLPSITEIMDDPVSLYKDLKRVDVKTLGALGEAQSWESVAAMLQRHDSVLCIVSRRDDARTLWELMPKGTIHLSALMCGAHRSEKISEIKQRLKDGLPTRVVSTQLVEAGVDLDFPVVYRSMAGLDSIAQAAGRCNREGLLAQGELYVFTPPSRIPAGHLRQASEIGRRLLEAHLDEPLAPAQFAEFFKEFYWVQGENLDKHGILKDLANDPEMRISFRTAAGKFKLIDEAAQAPVIVQYRNDHLISMLCLGMPERGLLRKLQRSVVNLPRHLHGKLLASGAIREVHPGIFLQGHGALYQEHLGFCPDKSIIYEPDELLC